MPADDIEFKPHSKDDSLESEGIDFKTYDKPNAPHKNSLLKEVAGTASAGLLGLGYGTLSAPHNIANIFSEKLASHIPKPKEYDFFKASGIDQPNLLEELGADAVHYLPYGIGGEAALAGKGLSLATRGAITGGVFGATQSDNPIGGALSGAAVGAGIPLAAKGWGLALGTKNAKTWLGNKVLDYLNKAAPKASAIPPQEAAQHLQNNYTDQGGHPLNVDIGTVANNPLFKALYNKVLKNIPGSGATTNINKVNRELNTKQLTNMQTEAMSHNSDLANQRQRLLDEFEKNHTPLQEKLNAVYQKKSEMDQSNKHIEEAPEAFNSLIHEVKDPYKVEGHVENASREAYIKEKDEATKNYDKFKNSGFTFKATDFPRYESAASDLMSERENLKNIFGSDTDLDSTLRSEISKADNMNQAKSKTPLTFEDALTRQQNLGKLKAAAGKTNPNEARLLGKMRDAITDDIKHALQKSGNTQLENEWEHATNHYREDVVPFFRDPLIRKTVTQNYHPQGNELSRQLHNTNNLPVYQKLPLGAKGAALHSLISGGKVNLTPEKIGANFSKVTGPQRRMIEEGGLGEHAKYFEKLPGEIEKSKLKQKESLGLDKRQADLEKQIERLRQNLRGNMETAVKQKFDIWARMAKEYEGKKGERYGKTPESSFELAHVLKAGLAKALGVAGMAGLPFARTLTKVLSDPELVQKYIKGEKY